MLVPLQINNKTTQPPVSSAPTITCMLMVLLARGVWISANALRWRKNSAGGGKYFVSKTALAADSPTTFSVVVERQKPRLSFCCLYYALLPAPRFGRLSVWFFLRTGAHFEFSTTYDGPGLSMHCCWRGSTLKCGPVWLLAELLLITMHD